MKLCEGNTYRRNAASQDKPMKERNVARATDLPTRQGAFSRSLQAERASLANKTIADMVNDLISTRIAGPAGHSRSTVSGQEEHPEKYARPTDGRDSGQGQPRHSGRDL